MAILSQSSSCPPRGVGSKKGVGGDDRASDDPEGWIMTSSVAFPAISAAFLASLVEAVEAVTIVLAVGTVRGWRSAGTGALAGLIALALVVLTLGPVLERVPLPALQLVVGLLLFLFGMRWLHKAILRAAGIVPLRDEQRV